MLPSSDRFMSSFVFRALIVSTLIAVVSITGCTTKGSTPQFSVTTTSGQLVVAIINAVYPQTTLTAANGTAPYMWAVTSGALPNGVMLSSAGVLSGTPTSFGTFNFTVTVTDSATPAHTATASLSVLINPALASVMVSPTTVTGGTASTGTVTLNGAAAAAATVTLSSNNAAATVPATVMVAAGATTATFQVTTTGVAASTLATITATYGLTKTATLTVNPPTVASVVLTQSTVTGGTGTTGTVTLTGPAATGGDIVMLSSTNTAATPQATVTVLAGATTAQFNVTTVAVATTATGNIQASFNSSSQTAGLAVVPAPSITSFTAASATITTGNSTTLTAVFSNGTGSVDNGVGSVTTSVSKTVLPAATTTYTLTVTNLAGTSVTKQITITVVPAPTITSFTPAAAAITAGSSTTLTAIFTNGTGGTATVDNGVGAVTSGVATSPVSPSATTTYTLTVTNTAGTSVTKQTTITVDPVPVITSFTAASSTIVQGNSTTLTAVFSNGTGGTATVDNGVGAVTSGTPVSVMPATTTTYTLTVKNGATTPASTSATATVTVDTPPAITSVNAKTFTVGVSNTFTVTTTGNPVPALSATPGLPSSVTFTDNHDGTATISGTPVAGDVGSHQITITAANVVSSVQQTFTLNVVLVAPPAITSAASGSITVGTTGTFTVTTTGSPTPSLSVSPGALPMGVSFTDNHNGTATIAGSATTTVGNTTFTITAMNGQTPIATQGFTLHIVAAPVITSFTSAAPTITAGSSTTLTAVFSNGTGGTATVDNGVGAVTNGSPATVTPSASTIYTLTVKNAAGTSVTQQATVTVVAAPVITSFTASPTTIPSGSAATLTPVFTGGTGAITNNIDSTSLGATSNVGINVTPTLTTTYTLTVTNTATTPAKATAMVTVTVTHPPLITSAPNATFIVGSNGTFFVTTTGSPTSSLSITAGSLPATVMFHDNGDGTATISGTPVAGDVGGHTVTITASNGVVPNATQSFTLTVTAAPAVVSSTIPFPIFDGGAQTMIAIAVANDAPGETVTASLSVDDNTTFLCTLATCGTLGAVTGTSGSGSYSVAYTPPPLSSTFVQTFPRITISSNLPGSASDIEDIEVDPAGILVTTDDTNTGANEASTIHAGAGLVQIGSAAITVTVRVYNDTTNAGVTFLPLTGSGYACATLSPNSCGTLGAISGPTLSGTTSTTTITYTPPASLPSAPYDGPRIMAVSKADQTRSGGIVFVLNSNAVTNLKLNYNTRFNSVLTGPAATVQTQTVVARLVLDTGLSKSINWTLTANGSSCSPTCGTLGTPTTTVNPNGTTVVSIITYTPPSSVPTGTGQAQPTLTATSADDPAQNSSFTFNIADGTCGTGHESTLNGQYALLVRGGAAPAGYGTLIGSFTAHGDGTITGGSLNSNNGFGPILNSAILTVPTGGLPASSYSVGSDNRGCLVLADSSGGLEIFRFSVGTLVSNVATEGRIIGFDDNTWRGRAKSGVLMKQDPTSFNAAALNGTYAFGEAGVGSNGGRFSVAGVVTSNGAGTLSNFDADFDDAGTTASTTAGTVTGFSGSYSISAATGAANGRGTATTTVTVLGKSQTSNLVLYMVSPSEALFMTTGNPNTEAILSGELKKQTGAPFSQTTLDGKDYVFYVEGIHGGDGGNDTVLGQSTFTTSGHATITLDENKSGVEQATQTAPAALFTIASNGRTTISGVPGGGSSPILYLIDSTSAFIVGTSSGAESGFVEQQTGGPFSNASLSGQFFFGGDAPTTGSRYQSGTVNLDGAGNINGNGDSSGPNGLKKGTISPANGGTYCISSSCSPPISTPVGRGIIGAGQTNPSIAYAVSGSKIIFMSTGTDVDLFIVQK
jgi:hypothetical protein